MYPIAHGKLPRQVQVKTLFFTLRIWAAEKIRQDKGPHDKEAPQRAGGVGGMSRIIFGYSDAGTIVVPHMGEAILLGQEYPNIISRSNSLDVHPQGCGGTRKNLGLEMRNRI